jgi:membrane associated rhomboid family serine protease
MSLQYQTENEETQETDNNIPVKQNPTEDHPLYSFILIGCLVAVWLVQFYVDSQDKTYDGYKSIVLAGFVKQLFNDGQYWRILTAGVLHSGIAHLFFNSYALYVFGRPFEFLSNRSHLPIVFLLSVIGGNLLSLLFMPEGVSVGASGGIIGLLGYLTAYAFVRRKILDSSFIKNLLINIGLIAFFGLVVIRQTDNFAHLGGFLTGATYGLIQVSDDVYKNPRVAAKTTGLIGKAAFVIIFLTCLFSILVMFEVVHISIPQDF